MSNSQTSHRADCCRPCEELKRGVSNQAVQVSPGLAKYKKRPTVRDLQLLELNFDTIGLVDQCETYKCTFLLFLLPLCFLLAETLTFFQSESVKGTFSYQLFLRTIQKINKLNSSCNPQLPEVEVLGAITILLKYDSLSAV